MRKILIAGAIAALALSLGSASAIGVGGGNELPNSCLIAGGAANSPEGVESCTFEASAAPTHGYQGNTPNDFVIFIDVDGDGVQDGEDTPLAEVSPTDFEFPSGTFAAPEGATISVNLFHGCADPFPACGWVGTLLVG